MNQKQNVLPSACSVCTAFKLSSKPLNSFSDQDIFHCWGNRRQGFTRIKQQLWVCKLSMRVVCQCQLLVFGVSQNKRPHLIALQGSQIYSEAKVVIRRWAVQHVLLMYFRVEGVGAEHQCCRAQDGIFFFREHSLQRCVLLQSFLPFITSPFPAFLYF